MDFVKIHQDIHNLLQDLRYLLDEESVSAIEHYLDHDEYEMAFEGLVIELLKLEYKPKVDVNEIIRIGRLLKLKEEPSFDPEIWVKLNSWAVKRKN